MGLNVELLEASFKLVAPQGEALVTRFYERLFEKYPAVKPLFKNASINEQKKKLLASLVLVIQNLRHPEKLTSALQAMGARHVGYGVKPAHYDAVGENLLSVLGEIAGEAWTPEVSQAWADAYAAIKTIMLQGAKTVKGGRVMAAVKKSNVDMIDLQGKVQAIERVLAVIEFALDGTVITANQNFCSAMGYALEEIQGKHHRMFCKPEYSKTGEYAAFWQKLNDGEIQAGVYQRQHKGGTDIWLQASYNPVLDSKGKLVKIVKFATDITRQHEIEQEALVVQTS